MSEPFYAVTPKDTPRTAYAIQLDVTLSPQVAEPSTPNGDGPNAYKQIKDETLGIATGHWGASLFSCFDHLVPNAFMATFCPCVSLAQITARLGMAPYNTVLLLLVLLASLELAMVIFTIQQFVQVTVLGQNETTHYYHAHQVVEPRCAVNLMFVTVAILSHVTFCASVWVLRKRIRSQFKIPGTNSSDCLAVSCCPCFATAQMASHIKSFTPGSCSFGPVDMLPRYQ